MRPHQSRLSSVNLEMLANVEMLVTVAAAALGERRVFLRFVKAK